MNYMEEKKLQIIHPAMAVQPRCCSRDSSQSDPSPTYCTVSVICLLIISKHTGRKDSGSQIQIFYYIFCVYILNGNSCTHYWNKSSMADSEISPQDFESVV